jgi:hypothetical protein
MERPIDIWHDEFAAWRREQIDEGGKIVAAKRREKIKKMCSLENK